MILMRPFPRQVQLYFFLLSFLVFVCISFPSFPLIFHSIVMKEASRDNLDSGSTAAIALIADGQILVANIGDSKAFLCSQKFLSPAEAKGMQHAGPKGNFQYFDSHFRTNK